MSVFLFWFYTRTDQSDPCVTVCSCSGSIPGQTSQTPICLCVPVLVLYPDRPVRPLYVCVFQFWFYTRTDQSDPCMSGCSCSGSTPGQTSQTPVFLSVRFLVLYQDRPVRLLYVCVFLSGSVPGQTSQTPVCLSVPFWFCTRTDQSDPCMSVCSCSGSIPEQTSQTPVCLCLPVVVLYKDRPIRPLYVCMFQFWFYTRTDQSDPCMSVYSCSRSMPGQTSQTPVCLSVRFLVLNQDRPVPFLVLYQDRRVRPLYVFVFLF